MTDRIAEIKAHCEEGRPIRRIDVKYLLDQIEQANAELDESKKQHEALIKRFQHLLQSDFIRSFDEWDRSKCNYRRDISEADKVIERAHNHAAEIERLKDMLALEELSHNGLKQLYDTDTDALIKDNQQLREIQAEIERLQAKIEALESDNCNAEMNLQHITAQMPRWTPVTERLPENGQNILVANAITGAQYVSHKDLIFFSENREAFVPTRYFQSFKFTHWMPLPEPPKEGE